MDLKKAAKSFWHFLWEEDSVASWVANVVVAFVLIKFVVYPGIGLVFGTSHPIVAVVSGSMEHRGLSFADWWDHGSCTGSGPVGMSDLYGQYAIRSDQFSTFRFKNGFNTGDLMVLVGDNDPDMGDVVVFFNPAGEPIIHRVVNVSKANGLRLKTKGDNNCGSLWFEESIPPDLLIGKAVIRVPFLGWVKIAFLRVLEALGLVKVAALLG
ncbi:hypothetical protein HY641_01845 [Candidatus Woesearchaeota archaeon]|nr:hypothetical protein [Candidatus Woesearchaeota archaeon]